MKKGRTTSSNERNLKTYITPPLDIYETADSYILFLDMPGVSKENLKVKIIDDALVVQGNFDLPVSKDGEVLFSELVCGEYKREITLFRDIDVNKIEAKLSNGVLILTLGKKDESKEIEIKIN